ncbi:MULTISPECIES: crotonyl-CoA carboxylase/reductase [unclassified Flavobacterium]|uniref:crotonyl-CoA carboxylase/reductase n=1 Tax=unclassified Flavobacterium TaxID=196869 RepID=UPI0022228C4A|nr:MULTISPECIES: crotonyl-CoA carboxylase/reductase [unclassified Flavobacterium]
MEKLLLELESDTILKDLYEMDECPPIGHTPALMHAYVIRPENHGAPDQAFQQEIIATPKLGFNEVLVKVMAAGVNYNGLWAGLGEPASPTAFHGKDFHIAGSDASGIIWEVGEGLKNNPEFKFKIGDEVIVHCGQTCGICQECNGGNPMMCESQKIWGYETPYGSFAQYTKVRAQQLLQKPKHLTWAEAGGYMLTYATVWRMLYGFAPNDLKPGTNVLVWGGSGGLGATAIQLIKLAGANAVAVTSSDERGEKCLELGAVGYINRKKFNCWGTLPNINNKEEYKEYLKEVRKFGSAIWDILGKRVNPDIVIDHIGSQTLPVSTYVVKSGGMVVFCGATSGFNMSFDASFVWMRQKRIQGSHFSSLFELHQANQLILQKKFHPVISGEFSWDELPLAHQKMLDNSIEYGNVVINLAS